MIIRTKTPSCGKLTIRFVKRSQFYKNGDISDSLGLIYEKEALYEYQAIFNADIKFIKDIIHPNTPFLIGATDGLICKDGRVEALIEVKSPLKASRLSIEDYINTYNPYSIRYDSRDKKYYVNEKSNVYYQVQLCLGLSNVNRAVVIFYSSYDKSFLAIDVYKNNEFINLILIKLEIIYKRYILPRLYNILTM